MKVLLSAFACDPTQGSEAGYGWSWAVGLANQGFEVHCITREIGRANIDLFKKPDNLYFYYVDLPLGLEKMYSFSQPSMYFYYLTWQLLTYRKAKSLNKAIAFDTVHHVTWGSVQLGSFLYKLPVPFVFGPAGGGQLSPVAFKKYFGQSWSVEEKRKKVSVLLTRYNPACRNMFKKASAIWVSNPDTASLVGKVRTSNVYSTLDAALPDNFFPETFEAKVSTPGVLKLLWVGRFMPRKGVLLLLDVMQRLQDFPGITLTMVGDGEQRDVFLETVKEKYLENTVFWRGKVSFEEVKQFYSSHDVFFFTSLRDSCPAQLVEAMAYGMPIVTLNLHGQAIIVNDETGFRCPCDTPEQAIEALTKAILTLYSDSELLTTMSKAAYQFALKQTWEQKIKTIVKESYPVQN